MSSAPRKENIYIFIDNSNLWIQGQQTYAEKEGMSVVSDPTWRFDPAKLKQILIQNSGPWDEKNPPNAEVYLYGSTPPHLKTVWDKIKSRDIKVNIFQRSTWTGREKLVDSTIVAQSVRRACDARSEGTSGTFVFVSGDADMFAAVTEIVDMDFEVHVWSWKNALASVYCENPSMAKVHELDEYLYKFGFTEPEFKLKRHQIDPDSVVVLDPQPKASEVNQFLTESFSVPFYRYEMARHSSSTEDLVIIPVSKMEHTKATELLQATQTALKKHGLDVMNYLEYSQQHLSKLPEVQVYLSSKFSEMPGFEVEDVGEDTQGKDTDSSYTIVNQRVRAEKARRRADATKLSNPCYWRKYCRNGTHCLYGHTVEERTFFELYGRKHAKKCTMCKYKDQCRRGAGCSYAHSKAELFCPTCEESGKHAMENCPQRYPRDRLGV